MSAKLIIDLSPDMPAGDAVIKIFRSLIIITEQNVDGVIADENIEFLHDFRVSIRKTRSGLGQFKKILMSGQRRRCQKMFKDMAQRSNRLRDLDVILESWFGESGSLDLAFQNRLEAYRLYLQNSRKAEQDEFSEYLASPGFSESLDQWHRLLDSGPILKSPLPEISTKDYADNTIWKRAVKVLRSGSRISHQSPDHDLHRLRINGKKLRYLLEFYSSLYPANVIAELMSCLKRIQDHLGDYNDLVNQLIELNLFISKEPDANGSETDSGSAVTELRGILESGLTEKRQMFDSAYSEFSQMEHLFKSLMSLETRSNGQ